MENKLEIFKNEEFGEIRTVEENGKILFCGSDVARALGYNDTTQAIRKNCKKDGVSTRQVIDNLGRTQKAKFINEGNLYRLVANSKLSSAEKFETWIFDDVLPTIRNTGGYVANDEIFINTYLPFADEQTKSLFSNTLKQVRNLNQLVVEMQPKVDYFDALVDRNLLTNLRDTAKEIGVSQSKFINYLLEKGFLYRDAKKKLKPYQSKKTQGLFELKEFVNLNNGRADNQTMVTPKGRETFRLLVEEMN